MVEAISHLLSFVSKVKRSCWTSGRCAVFRDMDGHGTYSKLVHVPLAVGWIHYEVMYWMLRADVCLHLILNGFLSLSKCRPFFLCIDTRTWSRPAEMPLLIDWDPFLGAAKLVTLEVPKWVISRFREALSFGNPWKVSDPELGIHWTVDSSYTEPGLKLHLCLMAMRVEALRFVLVGGIQFKYSFQDFVWYEAF